MKKTSLLASGFLTVTLCLNSQTPGLNEKSLQAGLKSHISVLASDKYEGRETGTKGEQLTIDYISSQFKAIGLEPKGTKGYVQSFSFVDGIKYEASANKLMLDNKSLSLDKDFNPMPYSSNAKVSAEPVFVGYGIDAPKLNYDDYKGKSELKGKIFVMDISSPEAKKDSSKFGEYSDYRTKINTAIAKGAAAILFISQDSSSESPKFRYREISKISPSTIPVIFVSSALAKDLKDGKIKTVSLETTVTRVERPGQNVMGFLDNKAANTIVIGAHLDHLGMGDEESSLYKGAPAIHHGADDNASGTAAVIEMAKYFKSGVFKNNNYLFICFSGEEKGLMGSNYYSKNPTIDLTKVNYMINMDMVGRMKKDDKTLAVYGTGTSPLWKQVLPVNIDSIKTKTIESGVGPSDHTSFYLKDIPVLHFFSGFHPDYHKPSDTEEKINYEGEVSIIKYIINIISFADSKGKIEFTKTKEEPVASKNASKPKVTMGVVPDYMYSGDGMKIDGVTEGKPAANAGLKAGDIIMQIGDHSVSDMQSYMKSLSYFSPGGKTKVKIKRGTEMMNLDVEFVQSKQSLSDKNYRVYSIKLNKEVPLDSVINDMKNYDVLFYGEEHNDSVTHYLEKTVFEKMNQRFGSKLTLSMEMFDRDAQPAMNEYLGGFIREKNFTKDARVWGNYRDYKPMVELAKEKKLDVICANAPSRYTNLAGRKGQSALKELPAPSKNFFAPLPYDTATGKYYDKLMEMSGHSPAGKKDTAKVKASPVGMGSFNLIVAQSLWDATMAYSISEYAKTHTQNKIMQVNGRFHSDEGFAVVAQLKKYNAKLKPLIISSGSDENFPNIDWTKYKNLGNYVIITDPKVPKTYKD